MKTIQSMFEHLDWANRTILDTLQQAEVGGRPLSLFSHTLHAEQVWLTRLRGKDSSGLPIWADRDLAFCAELMQRNAEGFDAFFAETAEADPDRLIAYANSKGVRFTNSARDILTHVALHGQYHRGQINLLLRESGHDPVGVDYILFAR
ncbi:DinB family protein [Saccharibacillus kuerlensis]|uniref:Damage-inducible protein DinB n=1 Tax=Saccharibacillus kuerlensis TaxID=459527 RepID=A0ABQ2LCI5_9BACL|nr:DinB family protein [Saccharibacillus kuerlensis]GGO08337.1 hypothetical protein GCM10010969_37700 [Saccharibacillus kuerlensis]